MMHLSEDPEWAEWIALLDRELEEWHAVLTGVGAEFRQCDTADGCRPLEDPRRT
jgi:hypothetical protein